MAKSSEIVQIDEISKGLNSLQSSLDNTASKYLRLVKTIEEGNKSISESAATLNLVTKVQKETAQTSQTLDALSKQLASTEQKLKDLEDGRMKTLIENRIAIQEKTKAIKDAVKAEEAEEGSLVRMRQRLSELTKEYDRTGVRTKEAAKEINSLSKEIGKAEEATNRHQRNVGNYKSALEGLPGPIGRAAGSVIEMGEKIKSVSSIGFAGLIGAAGAVAVGLGAAFKSVIESTQATSDSFQFAVKGMSTGLDFFWKTLATGNWSNFFENLGKAISGGYAYAKMLDEIADNNRALRIIESNARGEELRLEEGLKNKELSLQQRKEMGEARIALEVKLAKDRQLIADKNFENELKETMRQTGLSRDRLMSISKDFDSEKFMMANQYNEAMEFLQSRRINKTEEEYKKFLPIIKNTSASVKEYAATINGYNIATEKQQDAFVSAVVTRNEAINSAPENLKKVITKVHSINAEMTKIEKKANEDSKDAEIQKVKDFIELNDRMLYSIQSAEKMSLVETKVINEDKLKSNQSFLDKQLKQAQDQAAKEAQIQQDKKQLAIDLAKDAGNAIFEFRNMAFQKEMNELDKKKEHELSNKNLTEAQKAKIEADYTKKANEIKKKQAINDKLQALFNIAIGTAQGIASALKTPVLIPFIAAMGALQAALVAAQPIPKFAKGTQFAPERGLFGEAGRELMFLRDNSVMLADKPTYFEGSRFKGARIYSNPETERMIGAADRRTQVHTITDERLLNEMREVRKAIISKPVNIVDKENRVIGHAMSNHQTIYLNRLTRSN
jgi:hypothetical protein